MESGATVASGIAASAAMGVPLGSSVKTTLVMATILKGQSVMIADPPCRRGVYLKGLRFLALVAGRNGARPSPLRGLVRRRRRAADGAQTPLPKLRAMAEIPTDRLSLVVGVTGHRDIAADDEAPLRAAFVSVLERLARSSPHTPLLVLSGLAAGADSLAAEEAMARGIPVMACLPMPVGEYEKDFSPAESARFRALLATCSRVTVTSPARENGYVATGLFMAQYSHLLVAFWDEKTSRGPGGTAEVIDMRLTRRSRPSDIEDIPYFPDVGPVDLVVTPRISGPRPKNAYTVRRLYPRRFAHEPSAAQSFGSVLRRIDEFNVDLAQARACRRDASAGASAPHRCGRKPAAKANQFLSDDALRHRPPRGGDSDRRPRSAAGKGLRPPRRFRGVFRRAAAQL